ncbi:GNAT family N-acetyltransferase [Flavobacterium luteum]|uniref:GNAT family N-acetyltransferase n=1 Tax=Flavobacterium luteum TaxID=2026654 RepID=A0A7J5AKM1_9FLAO|nr:GNAT family N-acetyltransferase [Flavobacterium luteum]KAB1158126.1 GNAT family N-acetyltransferase [Flavobacterium luteum]
MSYRFRPATLNDLPVLFTFEQGIVNTERAFDVTLKDGEIHYYDLAKMIENESARVLVVEANGEIVASGFVQILEAEAFNKFDKYSSFRFMYVKETHRNKGLNKMILDRLIEWSDSKNIKEIKLNVYDENIPALNAYLKAGFKKTMVEMRLLR